MAQAQPQPADHREAKVWKALADPSRRQLLALVSDEPRTTGELCEAIPTISRTGVLQHLAVLEAANLVIATKKGRQRFNHINAAPLMNVCQPWIDSHVRPLASAMAQLKVVAEHTAEQPAPSQGNNTMPDKANPTHADVASLISDQTIHINAHRERVWDAIINETTQWWLADFQVTTNPKGVRIEPFVGGRWYEDAGDGAGGLWGHVQTILPPETLEITGALYPQWGGPATMHLTLTLKESPTGTTLHIRDALFGAITNKAGEQQCAGWKQLFTDGLKVYVENQVEKHVEK